MSSWFFVNLANLLFALAYLVKDIFLLRVISVVACAANMAYLYIAPDKPLWWGIGWDMAFVAINSVQIWILVREKRRLSFGPEERELYEAVFGRLTSLEYRRLLNVAHWESKPAGSVLAREGEALPLLMVLYSGLAGVEKKGHEIAVLKPGDFIGEMSFVSVTEASATVTAKEPTRLLCWDKTRLKKLLEDDAGLKMSLDAVMSCNMAEKLKRHA